MLTDTHCLHLCVKPNRAGAVTVDGRSRRRLRDQIKATQAAEEAAADAKAADKSSTARRKRKRQKAAAEAEAEGEADEGAVQEDTTLDADTLGGAEQK